jgi:hypothetical protein
MKAFIANLVIVANENIRKNFVVSCLEDSFDDFHPAVMEIKEYDIGEWSDEHPLNTKDGTDKFFREKSGSAYLLGVAEGKATGALTERAEIIEFLKRTRETSETAYAHDDLDYVIAVLEQG